MLLDTKRHAVVCNCTLHGRICKSPGETAETLWRAAIVLLSALFMMVNLKVVVHVSAVLSTAFRLPS